MQARAVIEMEDYRSRDLSGQGDDSQTYTLGPREVVAE